MKWKEFIKHTFQLREWDSIDSKTIKYIKNNFSNLHKEDILKLNLPSRLEHHILIRLEYIEFYNIKPE